MPLHCCRRFNSLRTLHAASDICACLWSFTLWEARRLASCQEPGTASFLYLFASWAGGPGTHAIKSALI